ncbi:MAG: hypothetical protein GTN78_14865 [Gemmatimonadales bacterium]|nr:hypothetical protein [Gemmatimonadales bacterium]
MLTVGELRELVREEFGEHLERATPATVRDFLDRLQVRLHDESGEGSPYVIEEEQRERSYEEIVADFFSRVLDYEPEKGVILLWLLAFEQHFSMIEEDYVQRALTLFGEGEAE